MITNRSRLTLIFTIIILFLAEPLMAYGPHLDRRKLSDEAIACIRSADSVNYHNPIARKMRAIKARRLDDVSKGLTVAPEVTSMSTVVILGDYTDDTHPFTEAEYQDFLLGANPTGSLSDYYNEVSYGQFQLTGSAHGPYLSDNTKAYYGVYGAPYPTNAAGFIWSILDDADTEVDFSLYDNDGPDGVPNSGDDDGVVDVLTVVCAGGDDNWGDVQNIHPHSWSLSGAGAPSAYVTTDAAYGGGTITIDGYTIQQGEKGDGSLDEFRGIGIFAHEFGHKLGAKKLGLVFCVGLSQEARIAHEIFTAQGFNVASVLCKVGRVPKEEALGIRDEEKIFIGTAESACNPIVQAKVLNRIGTDFNVVLGLCVGHDSLFFKYADAYTTVLAVKDRVTGHNPLAALYTSHMYHMYLKQPGF